jgi:hypothetical protein
MVYIMPIIKLSKPQAQLTRLANVMPVIDIFLKNYSKENKFIDILKW